MKTENKKPVLSKLSKKEDEYITVAGVVGAALSLTALLQHFYFTNTSIWATLMLIPYTFTFISYVLLAAKNKAAHVFLFISIFLLFIAEILILLQSVYTPIVMLVFIYTLIVVVLLYTENIPKKLKERFLSKKKEDDFWSDKL